MALKVGDKAPEFSLVDTRKKYRTLGEILGKKTIIAFYPAAFTGICTKEMCSFRDSLASLNNMNANVVGISVDPPFSNRAFAEQNKLNFPVLSDFTRDVSSQYSGLYMDLGGVAGYTAAKRSVFVLDESGVVKYAWISDNPGAEPNYDEVKSALAAI
ncbi:MAG: peroxiredoxin [Bacteroidota bacterium]